MRAGPPPGEAWRPEQPWPDAMMQDEGYAPLLDPSVLDRLRDELDDDDGIWKVFIQNFIAHLPERIEKLRQTLTTGDYKGAMDAVLSLKTSSQMVGAERLAELSIDLEQAIRETARESAPAESLPGLAAAHLRRIKQCGRQTTYLLEAHLKQSP